MNIDDMQDIDRENLHFDESCHPDLREIYNPNYLPQQIWDFKLLRRPEVYQKVLENSSFPIESSFSSNFSVN